MTGDSVLSLSLLGGWLVTLQKKFIKFPLLIRQLMRRRRRKVVYFRVFITFILVGLFPNPNDIIIMMMSDLSYRPITFIPACLDPLFLLLWLRIPSKRRGSALYSFLARFSFLRATTGQIVNLLKWVCHASAWVDPRKNEILGVCLCPLKRSVDRLRFIDGQYCRRICISRWFAEFG